MPNPRVVALLLEEVAEAETLAVSEVVASAVEAEAGAKPNV